MTGWLWILAGVVCVTVGVSLLISPFVLVGGGAGMVAAGLFVDFEPVKESQRAKRDTAAP